MPQRDENGHFLPGHSVKSPGRPPRKTEAEYLEATLAAVSVEDWRAITTRAVKDAKKGLPDARRWLSDYVLGKPPQILELRGSEAMLLAQVLKQFQANGIAASDVFEAMLRQMATEDAHGS